MRSRLPGPLGNLTLSIALLGTFGALLGATGVLAYTTGLPFDVTTACGCEAQPQWYVEGNALAANRGAELALAAGTEVTITSTVEGEAVSIECKAFSAEENVKIEQGVPGEDEAGKAKLAGCTTTTAFGFCAVKSVGAANAGEIVTGTLFSKLLYIKVGEVGDQFTTKVGRPFAELEFTNTGHCTLPTPLTKSLEGSFMGKISNPAAEEKQKKLEFPAGTNNLLISGKPATLTATMELELTAPHEKFTGE